MKPQRAQPLTRLVDANPEVIDGRVVVFDCPIHPHDEGPMSLAWCRVQVRIVPGDRDSWTRTGDTFETMTLTPSIKCLGGPAGCEWHGYVRDGRFETLGYSK